MINNRKPAVEHTAIYAFAPSWEKFQHLNLDDKFTQFEEFVLHCQHDFQANQPNNPSLTICLIAAPELIFSRYKESTGTYSLHSYAEFERFKLKIIRLQKNLIAQTFLIAGAIDYASEDKQHYAVTSYIVTKEKIQTYDKKEPTEEFLSANIVDDDQTIPAKLSMLRGKNSGTFNFKGIKIGLEICQDHEKATLLNGHQALDIHVLISAGQTRRTNNVCVHPQQNVIFIQCDRQPTHSAIDGVDTVVAVWNANRRMIENRSGIKSRRSSDYSTSSAVTLIEIPMQAVNNIVKYCDAPLPRPTIIQNINTFNHHSLFNKSQPIEPDVSALKLELIDIIHVIANHPGWPHISCILSGILPGICKIAKLQPNIQLLACAKSIAKESRSEFMIMFRDSITKEFLEILDVSNFDNDKLLPSIIDKLNSIHKALDKQIDLVNIRYSPNWK